ncbi:hypothetical protein MKW98_029228 [Papaver atlanticum]|uniref:RING-type domain-containing protein n=1 Tax=Papaver atlanticum TaxID=357466 RepID=A0AAD4XQ54_9MAGN|nr:hypothetical protein MKW98_029228 [Papaver atlanticum]
MITKGISIIFQKHGGLNVADQHNYSQCSTTSSSSSSEVSTLLSQLVSTHPHDRYMIKCKKTYSNLLISLLNEIANSICLVVFTVFLVITKIVIHIVVTCTIVHRKLHHRQTTRTANITSTVSLEEQEESGGFRLSLSDVQNLSSFEYETVVEPAQDCIVCLERFIKGESCRSLPRCNHVFHASCVDSWLIQVPSCPLCRQIVVTPGANQLICTAGES